MIRGQGGKGARGHSTAGLFAVLFLVAGCGPRVPPSAPVGAIAAVPRGSTLAEDLASLTNGPGVRSALWAIEVVSLDRNEHLARINAERFLVPASVAKIVTVATAADAVGWDYRWETTVRALGSISDGVLQGDLVVTGSGDPSIGGRAGEDLTTWIDAIRGAGIRRILGRVIGDDNALEEPRPQLAWTWDDLGYPTGAIFGALNLNENRATIQVVPSTEGVPPGLAVPPALGYRQVINRAVTGAAGSPQSLWPEQRPGETALTVAGSIPSGALTATLSVAVGNPTLHFAHVLRERLIAAGIEVSGAAADIDEVSMPQERGSTVLYTHRSRPLSEIVQPVMKDSVNVYAEAVFRLNAPAGALPTNDAAIAGARQRLAAWGLDANGQQLVDGSGLSRRSVVSAALVMAILRRLHAAGERSPFYAALPVAGVDGSLVNRMRGTPAQGNVRAKTGTMSNIRSLAGYVTAANGERLAFVILVNNFEGTGAEANAAIDGIAVRLASFSR
jgi:D-alanyl-D-alanine carboxypeptidase/D-alanyl-D-alanine-endopeptidase (penicillin-binding protein 4)